MAVTVKFGVGRDVSHQRSVLNASILKLSLIEVDENTLKYVLCHLLPAQQPSHSVDTLYLFHPTPLRRSALSFYLYHRERGSTSSTFYPRFFRDGDVYGHSDSGPFI